MLIVGYRCGGLGLLLGIKGRLVAAGKGSGIIIAEHQLII